MHEAASQPSESEGTLVEFRILGSLEVSVAGRTVPVTAHKQRTVLAALLLRANEVATLDYLAEALWGSQYPASAFSLIKTYVWQLRKLLAGEPGEVQSRIKTTPAGYSLRVMGDELDLVRFERLYKRGLGFLDRDLEQAAALLRAGLAMWTSHPLNDTPLAGRLGAEVHALEDRRRTILEQVIAVDLKLRRYADLIPQLRILAADDPLCETWQAQLMLALYMSGRRAAALEVFKNARVILVAELGVEPGQSLQTLQKAILNGVADAAPDPVGGAGRLRRDARGLSRRHRVSHRCTAITNQDAGGRDGAGHGEYA